MKTLGYKILMLLLMFHSAAFCQENTNQEIKKTEQTDKKSKLETLLESKEYVFIAETVLPTGAPKVVLSTSNYHLNVHPHAIDANLPYYGRAYSGNPYGDTGMTFKGEPSHYKLTKNKKDYKIEATVKGESDTYKIDMTVSFEGAANLRIYSNKKSSISYNGIITPPQNNDED